MAVRFGHEQVLLAQGIQRIAGVDEAGRGPLAGPVVAAAVMFPPEWFLAGIPLALAELNDSKQLQPDEREHFFELLTAWPGVACGVAMADVPTIDTVNILRATHQAMNEALARLTAIPEHVLVDGLRVESLAFPQTPLVKGDGRSYSIAAASVLAKVTRDRLMVRFDEQYPVYGFARHKGYGTPAHLAALAAHGPCPIHRRSFRPVSQPELPFL